MLSSKASLKNLAKHIPKQSVLVRADFNVPLKDGVIQNANRITSTLPTILRILENEPRGLVLMSHLGRPKGNNVPSMSLQPVADELAKQLGTKVTFLPDCVGAEVEDYCKGLS